ncbi:hypothetical protein [Rhizobium leguminosarum]
MSIQEQEQNTGFLGDEEWHYLLAASTRFLRGGGYAIVAGLLLSTIEYHIKGQWTVVLAIGLLGLFTSTARIGQLGLLILLAMALISPEIAQSFLR